MSPSPHLFLTFRPNRLLSLIAALPLLVSTASSGDVYRWRDAWGRAHFADQPRPGAERIEIKPQARPAAMPTAHARVERVYDGDTLKLDTGEKVRLLGINTPEIGGGRKQEEPGGQSAREWLKHRLEGRRIRLEQDVELRDRYLRLLAHVFAEDGTHINLELVDEGYATVDIHPPNLKYADALMSAEVRAERERRGLWARPEYAPLRLNSLGALPLSGWKRLTGKVESFDESRGTYRLHLEGGFEVHIPKREAHLFPPLRSYVGQTVELRGWISRRADRYSMRIRHPSALLRR